IHPCVHVRRQRSASPHVNEVRYHSEDFMYRSALHASAAYAIAAAVGLSLGGCGTDSPAVIEPRPVTIAEARGNTDTQVSTYVADADPDIASSLQVRS